MNSSTLSDKLKQNLLASKEISCDYVKETMLSDDPIQIQRILIQHPSIYSAYSGFLAMAKRKTLEAEYRFDDYVSETSLKYRRIKEQKGEKYTESSIKQAVSLTAKYKELREEHLKALESENLLGVMVKALEHKKDMLWNLSSNMRKELDTLNMSVKQ